MNFKDYGKVEWFDSSKGFGVAKTINNGSIFIHKKNGITGSISKGSYVLIGDIVIKNEDNTERVGVRTVAWTENLDSLCEEIFLFWQSNTEKEFNADTKWLIDHCNVEILKKIIHSNKNGWFDNVEFTNYLKNNYSRTNNDEYYCAIVSEFILEKWIRIGNGKYDDSISWLVDHCQGYVLEKIIDLNKDNWLTDLQFISHIKEKRNRFYNYEANSTIDIVTSFIFELWKKSGNSQYDENLKWLIRVNESNSELLKNILAYDYTWINDKDFTHDHYYKLDLHIIAVCNFLINKNKLNTKKLKLYNDDIKWIINNGNNSTLSTLLEDNSLCCNKDFIHDLKVARNRYDSETISQFLYNLWVFENKLSLNDDLKWIFYNGSSSILRKIIDVNINNWLKDEEFISFIRKSMTKSLRDFSFYEIFNSEQNTTTNIFAYEDKVTIIENFIYEVWNSQIIKKLDDNLKWLIRTGKTDIILRIINQDKQKWLINNDFVDYIRETQFYDYEDFKEDFLFEVCMSANDFKYNETIKWLLEHVSLDKIKAILTEKAGYNIEIIEKIYAAFFPTSKIDFYSQKALRNKDWSEDFKLSYIEGQIDKRNKEFSKLFISALDSIGSEIVKRESLKKETHAATDLASFTFCPASYAISQTYTIDIREQETVLVGYQEHERQHLLSLFNKQIIIERRREIISSTFHIDFKRILDAECVSQGHGTINPTVYYSKYKKLAGIPDYIFQDNNGCFAVEEKYTTKKYEEFIDYYDNHKIQTLVYLYLYESNKYKFDEVYLLYWFIRKDDYGQYNVYNYKLFKFRRTDDSGMQILNVFEKLESIQSRVPYPFPPSEINYRKCVKCSYFAFCEYKKGNDNFIELTPISNTNN